MPTEKPDISISRRVELELRHLDCLSVLPSVAARFFRELADFELSPARLAEIVELEPALMLRLLALAHQQAGKPRAKDFSIERIIQAVPLRSIRDCFLAARLYRPVKNQQTAIRLREQLIRDAVTTASWARAIADAKKPDVNSAPAYTAGLLHNIGNIALHEVMPRSLENMIKQADSDRMNIQQVQQKNLGLDYTIIGKRLAEKWHLPKQIILAIWLQNSDMNIVRKYTPDVRIAAIVQLALHLARAGWAANANAADLPENAVQLAESLKLGVEDLKHAGRHVAEELRQKFDLLKSELTGKENDLEELLRETAARIAAEETRIQNENRNLQLTLEQFRFIKSLLSGIDVTTSITAAAEKIAVGWQKLCGSGPVCVYLVNQADQSVIEAAVAEPASNPQAMLLNAPEDEPAVPRELHGRFSILDAGLYAGWLFEQIEADFNPTRTKIAPLSEDGEPVGAIVFEAAYPSKTEDLINKYRTPVFLAGQILQLLQSCSAKEDFTENLVRALTPTISTAKPAEPQPQHKQAPLTVDDYLDALADMAGGAAHELNNPLSVIAGRAQMLSETETDQQKKPALTQIHDNAKEISAIIEDLMSFANPDKPRPTETNVRQIIDEGLQLACLKKKIENINADVKIPEAIGGVYVDSGQIVSSLANVFCNCLESYSGSLGPVTVKSEPGQGGFITIQISDMGRGMDAETLEKAARPFFSSQPAGRKRGMGLSHAKRLIHLNGGNMQIKSRPDEGTTVKISLPTAEGLT